MNRPKVSVARWILPALTVIVAASWTGGVSADSGSGDHDVDLVLATLSSASLGAGTTSQVTLTVVNQAQGDVLGSANLTAPAGFAVQSTPVPVLHDTYSTKATAAVSGGIVELRNLHEPCNGSVSVSFDVTAPCTTPASSAWTFLAETSEAFTKSKGNEPFTNSPSSTLSTAVSGSCTLHFAAAPANANVNQAITTTGFDPTGSPVEVEAEAADGNPLTAVSVGLGLVSPGGGSATLSGTTSVITAAGGLAAFTPLDINDTGYYQLDATATSFVGSISGVFLISDSATGCTGSACTTTTTSSSSDATFDVSNEANGDVVSLGEGGLTYTCPGYTPVTGAVEFDVWEPGGTTVDTSSSLTEQITIEILAQTVQSSGRYFPWEYQVCYASTADFPTQQGPLAPQVGTIPGTSTPLYAGLLPSCVQFTGWWTWQFNPPPCLQLQYADWSGDIFVQFLAAPGDAWGST